jgi:hypothetical protein
MDKGARLGYSGGPIRAMRGATAPGSARSAARSMPSWACTSPLPPAGVRAGAPIITGCRVDGIVVQGGHAVGVVGSVVDRRPAPCRGARASRFARSVVLAMGAVYAAPAGAPAPRQPADRLAATCGSIRLRRSRGVRSRPVRVEGVMQATTLTRGCATESCSRRPILRGVDYSARGIGSKGVGEEHARAIPPDRRHPADTGTGRVRTAPETITYDLHRDDLRKTLQESACDRVYLAAGAERCTPFCPGCRRCSARS